MISVNEHDDIPLATLPQAAELTDFDRIFTDLHSKVSDIFIQPDYPIVVRYQGKMVKASERPINEKTMDRLIEKMLPSTQSAEVKKGFPQSWSHRILKSLGKSKNIDATEVLRFRCNSKSVQTERAYERYQITMRPIPTLPMKLSDLNLPTRLVEGLFPESGMVLFSGPTGSGKTTTLAAAIQELCYHPMGKVIITIEDPVEYNLHPLEGKTGFVTHCEIGRNVTSFPLAMRAALRENPDVIMTGEMRDEDSMLIAVEASQTGHAVYSTLHTNSVTSVFVRVAQKMPPDRMESTLATFIEASRTFVYQRLFPAVGGGVVPVIEYICLSPQDRIALLSALESGGVAKVTRTMTELLKTSGQSYIDSAKAAREAGKLTDDSYEQIVRTYQLETQAEHSAGGASHE